MWSPVGLRKYHYKASGGDGIPVELFQILKDDAVNMLHSIYQQIWKTQQCLFNLYAEYIMWNAGLDEAQLESRLPGEISVTSDKPMTPPLGQKAKK